MSAAALEKSPDDDVETKPHRYRITFLWAVMTNSGAFLRFQIIHKEVGYDEPITPDVVESELLKERGRIGAKDVNVLAWSKYV